jgi:hypothetical protein
MKAFVFIVEIFFSGSGLGSTLIGSGFIGVSG